MRIFIILALLGILWQHPMEAQSMTNKLFESYEQFKEPSIKNRRFKHTEIQGLIDRLLEAADIIDEEFLAAKREKKEQSY